MFSLVKIPFTWDQMIIHFVFRFKDNLIVGLKSMTSPSTQSCEVRKCYLCQELLAWFFVFVTWQLTWLAYDRRNRDRIYYQDIWWVSLWKDSAVSHTLCHLPGNSSFFSSFFFLLHVAPLLCNRKQLHQMPHDIDASFFFALQSKIRISVHFYLSKIIIIIIIIQRTC